MYFANASFIKDVLLVYAQDLKGVNETEYIVLEMTPVSSVDSTAVHVIQDIVHDFRSRGIQVAFAMVGNRVEKTMRKAGVTESIGQQWFFSTVNQAVTACLDHQANKRLQEMNAVSVYSDESISDSCPGNNPNPNNCLAPNEIGFSNDLHHAGTTIFISLASDVPMITNGFATVFHRNRLSVLKSQMEASTSNLDGSQGARFTYVLRSMRTGEKLLDTEIATVHHEVQEVIHRARVDARTPLSTPPGSPLPEQELSVKGE
mmetsp:Transcript_25207/g.81462  ORF Transcript_25207/g.81462 Transcript_25207/m.81462 type:complete len:260 (+) Transcript_25207:754-1533(+)